MWGEFAVSEIKQTQTNWFLPNLFDSAASLKHRFRSITPLIHLRDGEVVRHNRSCK